MSHFCGGRNQALCSRGTSRFRENEGDIEARDGLKRWFLNTFDEYFITYMCRLSSANDGFFSFFFLLPFYSPERISQMAEPFSFTNDDGILVQRRKVFCLFQERLTDVKWEEEKSEQKKHWKNDLCFALWCVSVVNEKICFHLRLCVELCDKAHFPSKTRARGEQKRALCFSVVNANKL